jgi:hypothetical protein
LAALLFRRGFEKSWIWRLFFVGLLGIFTHVFMDFWNDYGVHPLSPWRNQWFYGDAVSVVEPLFWFALLPFAHELVEKSRVRWVVLVTEAALIAALLLAPFTRGWVALGGLLWAALAFGIQKKFRGVLPAVALAAMLLVLFFTESRIVHARMRAMFPGERPVQLIASPAPANPFCWKIIDVSERAESADSQHFSPYFSERLGVISLWPAVVNPETCFYGMSREHDAPLTPVASPVATVRPGVYWAGEFVRPVRELYELSERSCQFERFRHFARAPYWSAHGVAKYAGDLRYDRGRVLGFSQILLDAASVCGGSEPIWEPPVAP